MKYAIALAILAAFFLQAKAQEHWRAAPDQYAEAAATCDCPDQKAKDGSRCGKRSAYCGPGGVAPNCYPADRTEAQQKQRRIQVCGK